ncbi:hypothetical protein [Nocardioides limicola]|uniref:hypothetical protein n=1 Tax=Nocardioides limicola TaxID=2803368 RepID=UPI00193B0012|nr:hypothetical protein [Nocardioides sp. DJM-14]
MRWFEPKLRFDPGPRAERIWFTDGEKIELAGWDRARLSSVSTIDGSQREVSLAARLADLDVNVWIRLVHPDHTWTRKYGPPRATYDDGFQQRVVDFAIGVAEDLREALRIPEDDLAD